MTAQARFTQADLKRAVAGVVAAGQAIARIEIDREGKIVIIPGAIKNRIGNDNEWADLE
jgi:hypothetical protein